MTKEVKFRLVRPARKAGGDRYEDKTGNFVIYIPQDISRVSGKPAEIIIVKFEVEG